MSKIYFAGSIRGGRADAQRYSSIIKALASYGEVLTEHVGNDILLKQEKNMTDKQIHDRDMQWLQNAEVVVAEVTQASLGVGYELAMAMNLDKKILCLFYAKSGKRLSAMIAGQSYFNVVHYEHIKEVDTILKKFFARMNHQG